LTCISIPMVFAMTVCGVRVVTRFRVDVPRYEPPKPQKEVKVKSPKKSKKNT
jgi:hypothetical protein